MKLMHMIQQLSNSSFCLESQAHQLSQGDRLWRGWKTPLVAQIYQSWKEIGMWIGFNGIYWIPVFSLPNLYILLIIVKETEEIIKSKEWRVNVWLEIGNSCVVLEKRFQKYHSLENLLYFLSSSMSVGYN